MSHSIRERIAALQNALDTEKNLSLNEQEMVREGIRRLTLQLPAKDVIVVLSNGEERKMPLFATSK